MSELEFDLLIVDEAQEGVDTMRTERAFRKIQRRQHAVLIRYAVQGPGQRAVLQRADLQLVLFRRAGGQRKLGWEDENPYEPLPKLSMFTYQLSGMIRERIEKGLDLSEEEGTVDYAFDLNGFFCHR